MNTLKPFAPFSAGKRIIASSAMTGIAMLGVGCTSGEAPVDPYSNIGPRACDPYYPAENLNGKMFEGKAAVVAGNPNAHEGQAGGSLYRVIVEFPDKPGVEEGVAFVDPGGEVKASRLTSPGIDGKHKVNMGLGRGTLNVAGVSYDAEGSPTEVLQTTVAAQYELKNDDSTTISHRSVPSC